MLTSALRSGGLSTTSVAEATPGRSPGVSSTAFRAQSPNLRFAPLMDMDFAVSCPLVRRWRLVSGFCPSTRTFVPCFLQTPPRGGSPCIITRPYLHQVGQRTFTSKLLSMPSTQRSRPAADAAREVGQRKRVQYCGIRRRIARRFQGLAQRSRKAFVEMQLDSFIARTRKQRVRETFLAIVLKQRGRQPKGLVSIDGRSPRDVWALLAKACDSLTESNF